MYNENTQYTRHPQIKMDCIKKTRF